MRCLQTERAETRLRVGVAVRVQNKAQLVEAEGAELWAEHTCTLRILLQFRLDTGQNPVDPPLADSLNSGSRGRERLLGVAGRTHFVTLRRRAALRAASGRSLIFPFGPRRRREIPLRAVVRLGI